MAEPFKLKFNFDVSTFKLLGRELITDRITALFELVKNCYDANSDSVVLEFHNVNKLSEDSHICIKDDGLGMSINDIRYKWMVIGTNSKRAQSISPAPYYRKVVGEKGVGRFAVEKLGSKVRIETTQKGTTRKIILELDWRKYDELSNAQVKKNIRSSVFFTEIENNCWIEKCDRESHGTSITIEFGLIEQTWTKPDVERAYSELSKLVSPILKPTYPFKIMVKSNEFSEFSEREVLNDFNISTAHHYILNPIETGGRKGQEYLYFDEKKEQIQVGVSEERSFGPVSMEFFYLDKNEIRKYKTAYKGDRIDGIIIYRDGIITTPFAENESSLEKKRDILGIDKRRYSGFFDKISSNNLIGYLNITKENNPKIKDATNRQDFIECKEYSELKQYVIDQIQALEKFLAFEKKKDAARTINKLVDANNQLTQISGIISKMSEVASPDVKSKLTEIDKKARSVQRHVSKGIKQYEKLKEDSERKEDLFLSLLSLQDYAAELSHMVKTTIGNIKAMAEFFKTDFPNPTYDDIFKDYATSIYREMEKLSVGVKFMLSYASSGSDFETFEVFGLIKYLFDVVYKDRFVSKGIKTILEYSQELKITHNRKFFEDIFENLISNSMKALRDTVNPIIKCTGFIEEDKMSIRFSDNGCGIPREDWESIFEIFKTTTQNQGGAGIGLFTVKKRIEALNGEIKVVEPEYVEHGATFLITLPFNK
ncbi:MAG: sensor histidine kinase [Salinivirgaceae bacterium]|nr:sensor histidine kinase [Salinivirgaceae bacterium]